MTPEQMRVAIAEDQGYEWQHRESIKAWAWFKAQIRISAWFHEDDKTQAEAVGTLPNYPSDLNACHKMWLSLKTKEERYRFSDELFKVVKYSGGHASSLLNDVVSCVENATAPQRCKAYCRMKGWWDDTLTNKKD